MNEATLYPNPFTGQSTLKFPAAVIAKVDIMDLSGKLLRSENFAGETFAIEQKDLKPGAYFLHVTTNDHTRFTFRFIVL